MDDAILIARVRRRAAEHRGYAEALLDLAQDQNAAIRRELSTIERGCDFLSPTGDNPGRKRVDSVMMGGRFRGSANDAVSTAKSYVIPTDYAPLITSISGRR